MASPRTVPFSAAHIPRVLEIEQEANRSPWSERSFKSELSNRDAHYLVLADGKEIIGYGGFWAIIDEAHITNIAIAKERRGSGLGRNLLVALLTKAREVGMTCVTLEVRISNEAAIQLYESLGFVRCGIRRNYYPKDREDAVVMWLYGLENSQ